MHKSMLLARSQLKGAKGQAIAIVALLFLASSMLHLWLMLSMDYRQNFDRCHDRLHAAHVLLAADDDSDGLRDFLTQTAKGDGRTEEISFDDAMHKVGFFAYNGGEVNTELLFINRETAVSRSVGSVEIVEEGDVKSGIYLPVLYKS